MADDMLLGLGGEPVPDSPNRLDEGLAFGANLAAEPSYMHVHGAGAAEVVVTPHPVQKNVSGEVLARAGGQEPEQLIFLLGQPYLLVADPDLVTVLVYDQRPPGKGLSPLRP